MGIRWKMLRASVSRLVYPEAQDAVDFAEALRGLLEEYRELFRNVRPVRRVLNRIVADLGVDGEPELLDGSALLDSVADDYLGHPVSFDSFLEKRLCALVRERDRLADRVDELLDHNTELLLEAREWRRIATGCACRDPGEAEVWENGQFVRKSAEQLRREMETDGLYVAAS